MVELVLVDGHDDDAIGFDQSAAETQTALHEGQPLGGPVVYENAMIVVDGDNARDECASVASHVPQDPAMYRWGGAVWGPIHQPMEVVDQLTKFGRVICSGTIDSFTVTVWDTGSAQYGTIACQSLGLAPSP